MKEPILILGAMDGEIAAFLSVLEHGVRQTWRSFEFHSGRIGGRDVVVARSGVGKTLAACVCQRLVDQYQPGAIIFTGIAGSVSESLNVGDTLIARDCIQHDIDATALGFARGEVPYTQYRILACDPRLVEAARSVSPLGGKTVVGRVLTGDQFIVSADEGSIRYLKSDLAGDVVEMEGASVGLVAEVNAVPFVIIRTVSDSVGEPNKIDFSAFLKRASDSSLHIVTGMLNRL